MQNPVEPCVGCPFKLPLAWGLHCSIQGLGKPLAALWPSDCLLGHLVRENNHPRQGWNERLVPNLSWWLACSLFPQYPHSRHVQWVTLPVEHRILCNEPRQCLPHYPQPWAPSSAPCLLTVGTCMEPVWHSWPKDTSG